MIKTNFRLGLFALFLGLVLAVAGCIGDDTPKGESEIKTDNGYKIKVIDGCQYIEVDEGIGQYRIYSLTHKGDCPSPVHENNQ